MDFMNGLQSGAHRRSLVAEAADTVGRRARRHGLAALLVAVACAAWLAPAHAQGTPDCQASYGEATLSAGAWASNSNWANLTSNASGITAVRITPLSGNVGGYQLKLANNWSPTAVYQSVDLNSINADPVTVQPPAGNVIGFLSHPTGAAGLTVKATLCKGAGAPPPPPPPPPPISGGKPPAQASGLALAAAFVTSRSDYWAKHPGVVANNLSPACVQQHDTHWTKGPDNKAYPTWHPPVEVLASGETCYYGHEHGDDPRPSPFYTDAKYQQQRNDGLIPMPFGYANEVLAANGGMRHEDHFGHKIYRENFEMAYGNSTSPAAVTGTGAKCTALLKLHQGTHSGDAFTHHLHEAVAHVDCGALPNTSVASRVHVTTLASLGRPGWFSNTCGEYPVPGQTAGARGTGLHNAPVPGDQDHTRGTDPVALGAPARLVNFNTISQADLNDNVDGERIIPAAACLRTYKAPDALQRNNLKFGHAPNDTWVRPLMITDANGLNQRMVLKSYYSVYNPARVFSIEAGGAIASKSSVDACRNPPAPGPQNTSELCAKVKADASMGAYSNNSPYNGTVRNVNFKSLHVTNRTGLGTAIWTDAYGRETTGTDPSRFIKQYVSEGNNGVNTAGIDATIATSNSVQVCRKTSGPYPTLSFTDPCYWSGNDDLLFSKEWWRDFSQPALKIHAPN
jgi:hypothetical protein